MNYPTIILLFFAAMFFQKTFAQQTSTTTLSGSTVQPAAKPTQKPVFIYLSLDGRLPVGSNASLDFLFGKGYSLSFFTSYHGRNSKNAPSDYGGDCFFGDCGPPKDTRKSTGLTVGRTILTDKPKVRVHLKGGLGFGTIERLENFKYTPPTGFFDYGPNYVSDSKKYSTVSFVFQSSVDILFTRAFGIGFGLFADINKRWPVVGVSSSFYLGYVRGRIKK